MQHRFSLNLTEYLTAHPEGNFRDLFLYCAAHTLGSHAKIGGAATYGNIYMESPGEFIDAGVVNR